MYFPLSPKAIQQVAAKYGLYDLFKMRLEWMVALQRYYAAGYPYLVWEDAIHAHYTMIPLLNAAIAYKMARQLAP